MVEGLLQRLLTPFPNPSVQARCMPQLGDHEGFVPTLRILVKYSACVRPGFLPGPIMVYWVTGVPNDRVGWSYAGRPVSRWGDSHE